MTSFQEYNMEKWWKESNFIVEEPDYFKLVIWVNINSDDTYWQYVPYCKSVRYIQDSVYSVRW